MELNEIFRAYGLEQLQNLECFELPIEYLNYKPEVEILNGSYNGFWQWVTEGLIFSNFTTIDFFDSTGYSINNKEVDSRIEKILENNNSDSLESWIQISKEDIKGIPEDKLNYHNLYELGYGTLAEELSEYQRDWNDNIITKEIVIYYYDSENFKNPMPGKDCLYVNITFFFDEYKKDSITIATKEIPVNGDMEKAIDSGISFLKEELEKIN